jgi:hypothetical protein
MRLILVTTAILLATSFSYGGTVNDIGSPNFWSGQSFPYYEYRDIGTYSSSLLGKEGVSRANFSVVAAIQARGFLADFNKVISVTATHSPSGRTYSLTPNVCRNWTVPNFWVWYVQLLPEEWMFDGTWSYTLVYTGSDKRTHVQICRGPLDSSGNLITPFVAGPKGAFPPAVSNVQIMKTDDENFQISWSGIGDNPQHIDYSMQIFDMNDLCPEVVYSMGTAWRGASCPTCVGTYDSALNRVSFVIPSTYFGRKVRIRNDIVTPNRGMSRAMNQFRLPE